MNSRVGRRIAIVALVTAATMLGGCGSPESRKVRAIEKGQQFLEAGNLDKARVEFRNALQLVPNDGAARYFNGVIQERLGNVREAAAFYQAALDNDPEQVAARRSLARLFLTNGAPERALDLLKSGLEKHPKDAVMLALRAASKVQLKDSAGALEDAKQAYAADRTDESAIQVLSGLDSSLGHPDEARKLLEGGVAAKPKSVDMRLALAQLYDGAHEDAKAEKMLREIIALRPTEVANRLRLARFLSAKGDDAGVEKVLRDAITEQPKDRDLKSVLVGYILQKRGFPAAESELKKMITASGRDDYSASFALAQLYLSNKNSPAAEQVYRNIIDHEGTRAPAIEARNRLATALAARDDRAGALKLVAEVLDASPHDADALMLRGSIELSKSDPKSAIADLRAVLRDQPNAVGVLRLLARAHAQNGEPALAEETLRRALDANPGDRGVRIDLGTFLVKTGKAEQAEAIVRQITKDRPADTEAQQLLFRASVAAKDYDSAKSAADGMLSVDPKSGLGHFFRGMLFEVQNEPNLALKEFDTVLESQPDALEAIEAMTRMLVTLKRAPEALKRLDDLAQRAPKSAVALGLKGDVLLGEKRYAEAEAALHLAQERAPKWWIPYFTLARIDIAKGDRAGAVAVLSDAIGKVGEPNKVRGVLAELQQSTGHPEEAEKLYGDVLKDSPNDLLVANNLAMLLVAGQPSADRLARAGTLVAPLSSSLDPVLLDTFGWVKFKQGDARAALPALEKAHSLQPAAEEVQYHLAMAQASVGQTVSASDNLKPLVAAGKSYPWMADAKAELEKLTAAH